MPAKAGIEAWPDLTHGFPALRGTTTGRARDFDPESASPQRGAGCVARLDLLAERHEPQNPDVPLACRHEPASRTLDRAIRGAAVRPLRAAPISAGLRRGAQPKRGQRSTRSRPIPEPPSFANTIEALERSGRSLDRVASVFFNLVGAHTNDELQAIEREIAPVLARHRSETYLNEALFKRIDAIKAEKEKLALSAEQARVLDRYHLDFTRAGAGAEPETKARLAAIAERLATLRGGVRSARAWG